MTLEVHSLNKVALMLDKENRIAMLMFDPAYRTAKRPAPIVPPSQRETTISARLAVCVGTNRETAILKAMPPLR
jgi:hypothetical protein